MLGSCETTLSKFARNLGWANYKDTRNDTNLIPFSSDLKAILYSKSGSEIITPRCMRNVVVFYAPQPGQKPPKLRSHRHEHRETNSPPSHHETTSRDHPPSYHETTLRDSPPPSQEASQGNSFTPPNVVLPISTHGRTASETTIREVDHDISAQPIAPSNKQAGQQQLSTTKVCPRDPSNGMSSTQLQPFAVASSPNAFRSHDDNAIVGNSPSSRESLPAAVDSTGALYPNSNGNGATGVDSFLRGHTANRAEGSTAARQGRANGMRVYGREQLSRARGRCRRLFIFVLRATASLYRRKRSDHAGKRAEHEE